MGTTLENVVSVVLRVTTGGYPYIWVLRERWLSNKRSPLDRKVNPVFAMVTGNHGGLPLHPGFEGEVAIVGADPVSALKTVNNHLDNV